MMDCPTCAAPNQASGRNCRKCGVLVVSFGAPSKAAVEQKSSFSLVPGLGTLALVVVLGYAGYFLFWPKAQNVAPVASRAASKSSFADLLSGGGSFADKLKALTLAKGARKQEDGHTNTMVSELESNGVVNKGEIEAQAVTPADGSNPNAVRDAANAHNAAQADELSKIGAQ